MVTPVSLPITPIRHAFDDYAHWRTSVSDAIRQLQTWLAAADLLDASLQLRIRQQLERLQADTLHVAFVAEYSRGKSELINALFFADLGYRLLPSAAGRTTMCPTELGYDASQPAQLSLLPLDTHHQPFSLADYQRMPELWTVMPFDPQDKDSVVQTFLCLTQTRQVSVAEAQRLGMETLGIETTGLETRDMQAAMPETMRGGLVTVPRWRYAKINYPHPLLAQGLVVLDTPGLNAMRAEPELTMQTLPNAHAIIFVLAADTGVTRSEMDVWRRYISGARWKKNGRMAILNKIDTLWDGLKSESEIARELNQQIAHVAEALELERTQVLAVSAQKALLAKVSRDPQLLAHSRLPVLEQTLLESVLPAKQKMVLDSLKLELADWQQSLVRRLQNRHTSALRQLSELSSLHDKNAVTLRQLVHQIKQDKRHFEQHLAAYTALRAQVQARARQWMQLLGKSALKRQLRETRAAMLAAAFTPQMQSAMEDFFRNQRAQYAEAAQLLLSMQQQINLQYQILQEHLQLPAMHPPAFVMRAYQTGLDKLEQRYHAQFNTLLNLLTHEKLTLTSKFFDTLASHVADSYSQTLQDFEHWLRLVTAPLESHLREQHAQLKQRIESVRRIQSAAGSLDSRIVELQDVASAASALERELQQAIAGLSNSLHLRNASTRDAGQAIIAG